MALAGCVSTASLESERTPTPSAERTPAAAAEEVAEPPRCAEWAGDTTMLINLDEVLGVIESADPMAGWTASGDDTVRGEGACAPVSTQPVGTVETCTAPDASLDDVARALSSGPLEYMFAAGAERQIAGYVVGRTTAEEYMVIGMQAWRFATPSEAQAAPILDALVACASSQVGDDGRVRVFEGTEPTVVASVKGRDVVVVRSARPVATSGDDVGLTATESSLLPEESVNAAEEWWRTQAVTAFSREPRS